MLATLILLEAELLPQGIVRQDHEVALVVKSVLGEAWLDASREGERLGVVYLREENLGRGLRELATVWVRVFKIRIKNPI